MGWIEKVTLDGLKYYYEPGSGEISWEKPDELKSKKELEEESGNWTWIPHPEKLWQPARIKEEKADGTLVVPEGSKKSILVPKGGDMCGPETKGRKQKVPLWPLSRSSLNTVEEDLVALDGVNEGMINHTLAKRYGQSELYTWVGASRSVLVSVNPYKWIPGLYDESQIELHNERPPNKPLPPHPFAIASDSYNDMLLEKTDQSVLISGESGAGKTEATKQVLKFLASVAGSESNVENKILMANPLLEAFGNAKTIRNNNSSRFGKWIEVYVDPTTSGICGAKILNYLLEKSRVVYQQKGERNYHIFYQMCQDSELSSSYELDDAKNFNFLNQSGVIKTSDVNDEGDMQEVRQAMQELDFTSDEKEWVFRTTAAVLHLGNVGFKDKKEKGSVKGSQIKDKKSVALAAEFLGVTQEKLEKVLCYRSISVRREVSTIPLDPTVARDGTGSLAKGLYGRLFDFLVRRVNQSLEGKEGRFMGILDIFGFEIFENNSFEQLCINFANEKLQQQFNRTTFKEEEQLYQREGIDFEHIEFIDNQVVLDLIEAKPVGILLMLDEECLVPEGSNPKFMNKIEAQNKRNDKFQTDKHRKLENSLAFEIEHYAGIVKYDSSQFMEKNKDTLFQDMYDLCASSKDDRTAALFPDLGKRQLKSLSYQFRGQLNALMERLYETDSRYIRCIKPNNKQRPDMYEAPLVVEQLRYSGVFEAVQIRKQGYPFRLTYKKFACRYQCINPTHRYKARDDEGICKELLKVAKQDFSGIQFGKTMLLYRADEHKKLKLLRNLALETIVPRCQRVIRGGIHREYMRRLAKATGQIQDALDVANDIEMLKEAINAVDDTIGPLAVLFKQKPTNLEKAKAHRDRLQLWVDLERIFERLTAEEDPDQSQLDELTESVARASELLDIPRTDKQIKLYDLARGQVIYMEINVNKKHLDDHGHKYESLAQYSGLKDPKEFAKKKLFGRAKLEETMHVWTKSGIPCGLNRFEDKKLDKLAKESFAAILAYSGLKKNPDPEMMGSKAIQLAIDNEGLRDEVYAQLIKQTTNCQDQESEERIWDITAACVGCFCPSKDFENFVFMHLRRAPANKDQYISTYHNTKYGEKPKSAPHNLGSIIKKFKNNKDRSRYSVMPNRA